MVCVYVYKYSEKTYQYEVGTVRMLSITGEEIRQRSVGEIRQRLGIDWKMKKMENFTKLQFEGVISAFVAVPLR